MTPKPFQSDSAYAGIPYRVLKDASVEALMPNGEILNFKTVEQFLAAANDKSPNSDPAQPIRTLPPGGHWTQQLPASGKPLDYYSILLETIKNTENNSSQIRQLVYERVRFNFKRDILFGHSTLGLADIVRHVNDFELAVARIEANAVGNAPNQPARQESHLVQDAQERQKLQDPREVQELQDKDAEQEQQEQSAPIEREPSPTSTLPEIYTPVRPLPPMYATVNSLGDGYVLRSRRTGIYRLIEMSAIGVTVFGVIVTAAMVWSMRKAPVQETSVNEPPKIVASTQQNADQAEPTALTKQEDSKGQNSRPNPLPYPLPSSFGIYALTNNRELTELHSLPIAIPDPRVALSAEITKPSETTISDGKPTFILFRRDLLNSAPQTLALRAVARVIRETKIAGGKPTVTNIDGTWRIRNISHELRVSPVPGQPEMVIARPVNDAPLAAGRYALVLNRVGYDFTINGKEDSPEFCLEGFEASNGLIFSQCRAP